MSLNTDTLRGTFEIIDGDIHSVFDIDPDTGLISTNKLVDREETSEYNLKVAVAIQGTRTYSDCIVKIYVDDINDVPPTFDEMEPSTIHVGGSSPLGQPIHKVGYHDGDAGLNGQPQFKIEDPSGLFAINNQGSHFSEANSM